MRILSLRLLTATPLESMREFYHETLGLPVLAEQTDEFTIGAGATSLTYVRAEPDQGQPFYHVAFNIPENKLLSAREWQLERTTLIAPGESTFEIQHDPDFPDDVVHFSHWNAHALFFDDPAGNVLEHIARHDLNNASPGPFTSNDILCASEIAIIVDDVLGTASELQETFGLRQYRQAAESFAAVGDEQGIFVVFQPGRILSPDQIRREKGARIFPTEVEIQGPSPTQYTVPGYPYQIAVS